MTCDHCQCETIDTLNGDLCVPCNVVYIRLRPRTDEERRKYLEERGWGFMYDAQYLPDEPTPKNLSALPLTFPKRES
jgi:hypothetical protein